MNLGKGLQTVADCSIPTHTDKHCARGMPGIRQTKMVSVWWNFGADAVRRESFKVMWSIGIVFGFPQLFRQHLFCNCIEKWIFIFAYVCEFSDSVLQNGIFLSWNDNDYKDPTEILKGRYVGINCEASSEYTELNF